MADPAASIITIATVSIAMVKETYKYIQEISVVNDLIKSLLVKLKDLHRLIRVVESTYRRAGVGEHSPSSSFVGRTLVNCQRRLSEVKVLVYQLASHDSDTWFEKLALKRRTDNAKKEIELAVSDIHNYMEHIRTGISCWSLDVASAHRRISEAMAAQQALSVRTNCQQITDGEISPLSRTSSDAVTLLGQDSSIQQRRASTATSCSRPSICSSSSRALRAHSDDSESVASKPISPITKPNSDWIDFHFQIAKCEGNKVRIEEIRKILGHHVAAASLITSTDNLLRTPLHLAAQRGDTELARMLITFGADINARDSEPSSVLDLAIANNHRKFVAFLLENGVHESAILNRNTKKLAEMKRIIEFSQSTAQSASPRESRKMSWGIRRGLST